MKAKRPLGLAAALVLAATAPAAAQRLHLGVHAGYDIDNEVAALGGQALLPMSPTVSLYPSLDYYFVDTGSRVGLNLDLRLHNPLGGSPWYAGGGLSLLRNSVTGSSNTDAGANVFAGYEPRFGPIHPYVEVRGLLRDRSSVMLLGGFNWTLY